MLNKYIPIICTVFLWGGTELSHAQKINFQGSISEFTCNYNEPNKHCKEIQKTIKSIKSEKSSQGNETLNNSNSVANITTSYTDKSHKVIVLSYH
jgi:prefoldin subunit 5